MKNIKLLLLIVFTSTSCNYTIEDIHYGQDECFNCKMMIIDKKHASEFMTSKGKSYKFDSIECMIDYIDNIDELQVSVFLVNDYGNPGRMINTNNALFLISDNVTSPMGANLSAFSNFNDITKVDSLGDVYNWNELRAHIRKL